MGRKGEPCARGEILIRETRVRHFPWGRFSEWTKQEKETLLSGCGSLLRGQEDSLQSSVVWETGKSYCGFNET